MKIKQKINKFKNLKQKPEKLIKWSDGRKICLQWFRWNIFTNIVFSVNNKHRFIYDDSILTDCLLKKNNIESLYTMNFENGNYVSNIFE